MRLAAPSATVKKLFHLATAAVLFFFVAASAPHRVHHFFEQPPFGSARKAADHHTRGHGGEGHSSHDHDHSPPRSVDCPALLAAQNAHAISVNIGVLAFWETTKICFNQQPATLASFYSPAPFSQRAPPRV